MSRSEFEVAECERFDCRGERLGSEGWKVDCLCCWWCTGSHRTRRTFVGLEACRDLGKAKPMDQKSRMEIYPSGARLTATSPHFHAVEAFVEPPHIAHHHHHQELQNHHSTVRLAPHPLPPVSFSAVCPSSFSTSTRIQSLLQHILRTHSARLYI